MHRLRVPSATRKQALHRQIYGHRQPGPGGKASLPLALPSKGGKTPRKEKKSALRSVERTIYYWVFAEDSTCCLLLIFSLSSLASDACLNKVWKCIYQSPPLQGLTWHSLQKFWGPLEATKSSSEEGAMPLSLATSIQKRARAPCLVVRN